MLNKMPSPKLYLSPVAPLRPGKFYSEYKLPGASDQHGNTPESYFHFVIQQAASSIHQFIIVIWQIKPILEAVNGAIFFYASDCYWDNMYLRVFFQLDMEYKLSQWTHIFC